LIEFVSAQGDGDLVFEMCKLLVSLKARIMLRDFTNMETFPSFLRQVIAFSENVITQSGPDTASCGLVLDMWTRFAEGVDALADSQRGPIHIRILHAANHITVTYMDVFITEGVDELCAQSPDMSLLLDLHAFCLHVGDATDPANATLQALVARACSGDSEPDRTRAVARLAATTLLITKITQAIMSTPPGRELVVNLWRTLESMPARYDSPAGLFLERSAIHLSSVLSSVIAKTERRASGSTAPVPVSLSAGEPTTDEVLDALLARITRVLTKYPRFPWLLKTVHNVLQSFGKDVVKTSTLERLPSLGLLIHRNPLTLCRPPANSPLPVILAAGKDLQDALTPIGLLMGKPVTHKLFHRLLFHPSLVPLVSFSQGQTVPPNELLISLRAARGLMRGVQARSVFKDQIVRELLPILKRLADPTLLASLPFPLVVPLLRLILEACTDSNVRLRSPSSGRDTVTIQLTQHVTRIFTGVIPMLQAQTQLTKNQEPYKTVLKPLTVMLKALHSIMSNTVVDVCVFELFGDTCLQDCLAAVLTAYAAVSVDELSTVSKLAMTGSDVVMCMYKTLPSYTNALSDELLLALFSQTLGLIGHLQPSVRDKAVGALNACLTYVAGVRLSTTSDIPSYFDASDVTCARRLDTLLKPRLPECLKTLLDSILLADKFSWTMAIPVLPLLTVLDTPKETLGVYIGEHVQTLGGQEVAVSRLVEQALRNVELGVDIEDASRNALSENLQSVKVYFGALARNHL
ncbi:hypothetical protein KIPB_003955, partial [Kipferlia bialata]